VFAGEVVLRSSELETVSKVIDRIRKVEMRYFYDLEFNDPGYGSIELISIGMVAEDGREYYAVNEMCDLDSVESNEWLRENVLPHLPVKKRESKIRPGRQFLDWDFGDGNVKELDVIAREVEEFMGGKVEMDSEGKGRNAIRREHNELWAYYGAYDHVVMCRSLWGKMINLPLCVPMWTHELMQLWEDAGKPAEPLQDVEHHALMDARWNRDLFVVCKRYRSLSKSQGM
jgi:hypothetical protein